MDLDRLEKDVFPLVSIVIPSYNAEKTIGQCLESIKNQSYPNLEVIVVDDGSKDETIKSVSKYNVSIIALENNYGAPHAMNVGAELAKGEYIFFLDSDALAPKWLIEKTVDILKKNADYAAGGGWYVANEGHRLYSLLVNIGMLSRLHGTKQVQVYEGRVVPQVYGCFLAFRRNVLEKEKFSEEVKAIYDQEFMARLASKGYKIFFAKDLFVFHPVPSTLSKIVKLIRIQSMWLGVVGKKRPIIAKYHALLLFGAVSVLVLSLFVSPLVLGLVFVAYTAMQFHHFLLARRYFPISFRQILSLVGLSNILFVTSLISFTIGLLVKPRSHWK